MKDEGWRMKDEGWRMKDDGTRLNPIQSNNIFILNKIKYTQMEAISNFFFGKEQDLENPDD